jgi:hypothetical protein
LLRLARGEVGLRLLQGRDRGDLARAQHGLAVDVALGRLEHDLRVLQPRGQHRAVALGVIEVDAGALQPRLLDSDAGGGHLERGARLLDAGDEAALVDPRQGIALVDAVVEVDEEVGDLAGQLRADLDGVDRLQRAGGGDDLLQRPALDRRRDERGRLRGGRRDEAGDPRIGLLLPRGQTVQDRAQGQGMGLHHRGGGEAARGDGCEQGADNPASHHDPPSPAAETIQQGAICRCIC